MGFLTNVLEFIFPPKCVFCRKSLKDYNIGMCEACKCSLPFTGDDALQKGEYPCCSPLYYDGIAKESFDRFKFDGATKYNKTYGKLIADSIKENLSGQYNMITWVPLSENSLKKRGYDQSMLLAMSTALELYDVAVEILCKNKDIPEQTGVVGLHARKANVSGVYSVKDPELVSGKKILLIDDSIMSGSTLYECAGVLMDSGAVSVVCATLVRARNRWDLEHNMGHGLEHDSESIANV